MVWFKNIKNIHGLVNIVKDWKKSFYCWQDDTIYAYKSFYLHWSPSTKVNLVVIYENEDVE